MSLMHFATQQNFWFFSNFFDFFMSRAAVTTTRTPHKYGPQEPQNGSNFIKKCSKHHKNTFFDVSDAFRDPTKIFIFFENFRFFHVPSCHHHPSTPRPTSLTTPLKTLEKPKIFENELEKILQKNSKDISTQNFARNAMRAMKIPVEFFLIECGIF